MKKKLYEKPAMRVIRLQQQAPLMQFSHSGYGAGGDGFGSTGFGGSSAYGDGGPLAKDCSSELKRYSL